MDLDRCGLKNGSRHAATGRSRTCSNMRRKSSAGARHIVRYVSRKGSQFSKTRLEPAPAVFSFYSRRPLFLQACQRAGERWRLPPSSQVQFDRKPLSRRRFSRGSCSAHSLWAFFAAVREAPRFRPDRLVGIPVPVDLVLAAISRRRVQERHTWISIGCRRVEAALALRNELAHRERGREC